MRGKEFQYDIASPQKLAGMSPDRLAVVHASLLERSESSNSTPGRRHLRGQAKKIAGELRRRERYVSPPAAELSVLPQFPTLHEYLPEPTGEIQAEAVAVEAHHDDLSMLKLTRELKRRGVRLRVITLTDSSQRGLEHITPEELDPLRWDEGGSQNRKAGAAERHRIGTPDMQLSNQEHMAAAASFLEEYSEGADFFFAPNLLDGHPDHSAAHEVAVKAAGKRAVYGTDTITGKDALGQPLIPDWYVRLSKRSARAENRFHNENKSQVTNLPEGDIFDVFDLYAMTRRRGLELGVPHAAVVFGPVNTKEHPLGDLLDLKPV